MRLFAIFTAAFLFLPVAEGKTVKKSVNSGASQAPKEALVSCIQNSVLGVNDSQCETHGDSDFCVGLKRSLDYSRLETECKRFEDDRCMTWKHQQNTQEDWTSVASGHLVRFSACVRDRYATEKSNGYAEALADSSFTGLLDQIEDGSGNWLLTRGTVLRQTLEGKTFGQILADSPYAKKLKSPVLYGFRNAADRPMPLRPLEVTRTEGSPEAEHPARNPAQEGENLAKAADGFLNDGTSNGASSLKPTQAAAAITAKNPASNAKQILAFVPSRRPKSAYSLGLDRTLFERVNDAYLRNGNVLRGSEDFLREIKNLPPSHDLSEMLRRREAL